MLESHNAVLCLSMGKKLYYFFLFLPNVDLKQFQKVFKCPQRNTTTEEVHIYRISLKEDKKNPLDF